MALASSACGGSGRPRELREWTDELAYRIVSDPMPPRAREKVLYRVVVTDRKSGQPIQGGEGRIFATSRDRANVWDALERGAEVGTYYGNLNFVTSGDWAVAIQFRRDSVHPLERVDWMQDVHAARAQ